MAGFSAHVTALATLAFDDYRSVVDAAGIHMVRDVARGGRLVDVAGDQSLSLRSLLLQVARGIFSLGSRCRCNDYVLVYFRQDLAVRLLGGGRREASLTLGLEVLCF